MKLEKNGYVVFVNVICVGIIISVITYLIISWNRIPDKIPGHYNAAGVVDRWGNKGELLFLPMIILILYASLTGVEKFPQIWNTGVKVTEQNKDRVYRILQNLLCSEKLFMVIAFSFITINSCLLKDLPSWFLPLFLFLVFGLPAFFIFKLFKAK